MANSNQSMPVTISSTSKLSEGWHYTERYGDVFVTEDGTTWTVRQVGNELQSVPVLISSQDIIKTPSIGRLKHAQAMRRLRKSRGSITRPSSFALQQAKLTADSVR